jgi:fatty-acyl-CoA synthase
MNLATIIARRAALTPGREAILEQATGRRFTYAELDDRSRRTAVLLRERFGVGPGDRIAVCAHNGAAYVELLLAAAWVGAVLVPLNWRLAAAELAHAVEDCAPRVVAVGAEQVELIAELATHVALPQLLALDGADLDALDHERELAAVSPSGLIAHGGGDDPLCILYTSGTTGRPKGAVIPHRQVVWNCITTVASWGLRDTDVAPVLVPMFHAGGLFVFTTPILYAGGRLILTRRFESERDLDLLARERCTVVLAVPTMYRLWRETEAYRRVDLSHLRFLITGGAPCPPSLMQAWRDDKGVVFRQGYGATEVGPNCFAMTGLEPAAAAGSIGRPVLHTEVRLSGGDRGELLIRGPHVFSGYWNRPEATAEVLRGGWYYTGDLARRDPDGCYYIVGRAKDMIISGGENVYAAEVEAVFAEHPAVAEAALVGQPDPTWGEIGVMYIVPRPGAAPRTDELVRFCAGRLARYKIPKRVVVTDDLPRTALGKPDKPALRRELVGNPLLAAANGA